MTNTDLASKVRFLPDSEAIYHDNQRLKPSVKWKRWIIYGIYFNLVLSSLFLILIFLTWSAQRNSNQNLIRLESQMDESFQSLRRSQLKIANNLKLNNAVSLYQLENHQLINQPKFNHSVGVAMASNYPLQTYNYSRIDEMLYSSESDLQEAVDELEGMLLETPNSVDILKRLAEADYYLAVAAENRADLPKVDFFTNRGVKYTNTSLELDSSCLECYQLFVEIYGTRIHCLMGLTEVFMNHYLIEMHMNKLRKLDPNFWFNFYFKASVARSISELSWVERELARLFVDSEYVDATPQEIISLYEKSLNLKGKTPYSKVAKYYIGKIYLNVGDNDLGFEWIERAKNMPTVSPMEHQADKLLKELLETRQIDYEQYLKSKATSNNMEPVEINSNQL